MTKVKGLLRRYYENKENEYGMIGGYIVKYPSKNEKYLWFYRLFRRWHDSDYEYMESKVPIDCILNNKAFQCHSIPREYSDVLSNKYVSRKEIGNVLVCKNNSFVIISEKENDEDARDAIRKYLLSEKDGVIDKIEAVTKEMSNVDTLISMVK